MSRVRSTPPLVSNVISVTPVELIAAAGLFKVGDRVRHYKRPESGTVTQIDFRLAQPVIWVQPDKDEFLDDAPFQKPYNPMELAKIEAILSARVDGTRIEPSNSHEILDDFDGEDEASNIDLQAHMDASDSSLDDRQDQDVPESRIAPDSSMSILSVNDSLSDDEERDRSILEKKVERAFVVAGTALRELRDRKLYRDRYKTFEDYCKIRFGFQRRHSYQLIEAATVVDNLCANCAQNERGSVEELKILPTNECQVRSLTRLDPIQQREVWQQAVSVSGGKVPSGRIVKDIVEQLKKKDDDTPLPISYNVDDVVEIHSGGSPALRKHDGMWGIVTGVGSFACTVYVSIRNTTLQCKACEMNKVDEMYVEDIRAVSDRVKALSRLDLDPAVWSILETLARQTCFSQVQIDLLEWIELRYGLSNRDKIK